MSKLEKTKKTKDRLARLATSFGLLQPGQPVAVVYRRNGQDFPVVGYHVFDESSEIHTRSGLGVAKLKQLKPNNIWIRADNLNAPIQVNIDRVIPVTAGKHYFRFEEVFGSSLAGNAVATVIDVIVESEKDDLSLGLDYQTEDELDEQ